MAKHENLNETKVSDLKPVFIRLKRSCVFSTFEVPDPMLLVEPGQAQSVEKLFHDYVLGKLDPRDIGGGSYDSEEGVVTDAIDPFNSFGMTLEDADALRQVSSETIRSEKRNRQAVANASNETKQDEPQATPPGSRPAPDLP